MQSLIIALTIMTTEDHIVFDNGNGYITLNGAYGNVTIHNQCHYHLKECLNAYVEDIENGIVSDVDEKHVLDLNHPDAVQYDDEYLVGQKAD